MRTLGLAIITLILLLPTGSSADGTLKCGIKPIPDIGCRIGSCVNGEWEQICDSAPSLSCGIKPIPDVGCRIGQCVNGEWEQVCDISPMLDCGIRPIPDIGCKIERCVDGEWEQVCDNDRKIPDLPDNVIGFTAKGKVTSDDYQRVLIPAIEEMLKVNKKVRFLYHIGEDLESFDVGAMWEDTKVGISHFASWERMAIVTDIEWLRVT